MRNGGERIFPRAEREEAWAEANRDAGVLARLLALSRPKISRKAAFCPMIASILAWIETSSAPPSKSSTRFKPGIRSGACLTDFHPCRSGSIAL